MLHPLMNSTVRVKKIVIASKFSAVKTPPIVKSMPGQRQNDARALLHRRFGGVFMLAHYLSGELQELWWRQYLRGGEGY